MNLRKIFLITGYLILAGFAGAWIISCSKDPVRQMIIVTRVPVEVYHSDEGCIPAWPRAGLVAVHLGDNQNKTNVLTSDFYSACSPNVSYDATHFLFSGQKGKNDPWQVWEMNLKKKTAIQVTHCKESCYTPFYLPGNRLVFTREMPDTGTGTFLTLFTMNLDGANLQQITFHPNADIITTILKDGRILMHSEQVYPHKRAAKYLAMRPNGTKAELFYKGNPGSLPGFRVHETDDGMIWFIEQDADPSKKKDIVSIRYNRPLHSRINYTTGIPGDFYGVLPADSGNLYVSYQEPEKQTIGLFSFSTKDKKVEKTLLSDTQYHYLDPVMVEPYQRPRNLPNELMPSYPTGLLVSQNINLSADTPEDGLVSPKAVYIEIMGMDKNLGIVPVEQDGSFYLKIPADVPFRLQTLDKNEQVVLGPSDWYWVRPFERRGCVGCHEDPELSPENVVPMAVNHFPVTLPLDSTQMLKRSETFKLGNFHR